MNSMLICCIFICGLCIFDPLNVCSILAILENVYAIDTSIKSISTGLLYLYCNNVYAVYILFKLLWGIYLYVNV